MKLTTLLIPGGVALVTIGTALIFLAVTLGGLFIPGIALIDLGLLLAAAGGILSLRAPERAG